MPDPTTPAPVDEMPLPEPDGSAEANKERHPEGGYTYNEVPAWSEPLLREVIRTRDAQWSAQVQALRAEVEAMRRDAERYRWLAAGPKKRQGLVVPDCGWRLIPRDELRALMQFHFWCSTDELGAAIDSALQSSEQAGAKEGRG